MRVWQSRAIRVNICLCFLWCVAFSGAPLHVPVRDFMRLSCASQHCCLLLSPRTLEFLPTRVWAKAAQTLVGKNSRVLSPRTLEFLPTRVRAVHIDMDPALLIGERSPSHHHQPHHHQPRHHHLCLHASVTRRACTAISTSTATAICSTSVCTPMR